MSYPVGVDGDKCYMVEVLGLLEGGETYLIDCFALNRESGAMYYYNAETAEFEQFYTVPFFACKDSPDGSWRAESLGAGSDGPSGMYSLREMRIISLAGGEIKWSSESFLCNRFGWSPDSRFVAAEYSGRTWVQVIVVYTGDFNIIVVPGVGEILAQSLETPPINLNGYSVFRYLGWNGTVVNVAFEWNARDDVFVTGEYEYDVVHKTLSITQIDAG